MTVIIDSGAMEPDLSLIIELHDHRDDKISDESGGSLTPLLVVMPSFCKRVVRAREEKASLH